MKPVRFFARAAPGTSLTLTYRPHELIHIDVVPRWNFIPSVDSPTLVRRNHFLGLSLQGLCRWYLSSVPRTAEVFSQIWAKLVLGWE